MADDDKQREGTRATIAIYDRPPWWRRRRTWVLALPVAVSVVSVALFVWFARN